MKGFEAEFRDLDHYIRVITDRIWEGQRIDDIRRYYSDDCAVETPSSVSIGIDPVMEGTRATLVAFPDRRLLAEDVIISGDENDGFLSSHRILSPMTHIGPGIFGPPSERGVLVRTIADCVCINNRIVHEWLVRDQSAIARQIGLHERDLAQRWLNERAGERSGFGKSTMPAVPAPYVSFIDSNPMAQRFLQNYREMWSAKASKQSQLLFDDHVIVALPGGEMAVGAARSRFWDGLVEALPGSQFEVEHLVANERAGRATSIAMRWRVQSTHSGEGRYGAPTGRPIEVLGISHADVVQGRVVREWVLIDEVALWMQILQPQAAI